MKKIYPFLTCIMMLLVMPLLNSNAAESVKIVSSLIDNTSTGNCIIRIYAHGDSHIMGFRLKFTYPSDKIRPISAAKGDITKNGMFTDNISANEGTFNLLWHNTEEVFAEGEIAVISAELLKTNEPFTIDVDYEQEDTFNENFEDVIFVCEPIYTQNIAKAGKYEENIIEDAPVKIIIESIMKDNSLNELSDSQKQDILNSVNSSIQKNTNESNYFSDFDKISVEYGKILLDKLPDEAENLPSNQSAAELILNSLSQCHDISVNENNVDVITEYLEKEGLDKDYGKYIEKEDLINAYSNILEEGDNLSLQNKTSHHNSVENPSFMIIMMCIVISAVISSILFYYVRRRKNAQN